jgi:hypothetical protein
LETLEKKPLELWTLHFIYNALFLLAAILWGDWKRWKKYYPTILFFIVGDFLKNFLLYNHLMWSYQETIFGEQLLRNHTIIALMIAFIVYPSTILIYLGRFPQKWWKQALWIVLWVSMYVAVEYVNLVYLDLINHHHGWTMWWSLAFNFVMFSIFRIHYKKPLLAIGLSVIWVLFLWNSFGIPIDKLR